MASPQGHATTPAESSSPARGEATPKERTDKDDHRESVDEESQSSRSPAASPAASTSDRESEPDDHPVAKPSEGQDQTAAADGDGDGATSSTSPPLPSEPIPEPEDDGWEYHWVPASGSYWFYNRITGAWQQENPRVPSATTDPSTAAAAPAATTIGGQPPLPPGEQPPGSIAGGYNPAIHGDYDPTAWYAQGTAEDAASEDPMAAVDAAGLQALASGGFFNRRTGQWQAEEQGAERHSDEAKSRRQMNSFFDVDAAANAHDGRSLKAERAGKKPTKAELKAFKEKRRAKKEEKRRAWLRD